MTPAEELLAAATRLRCDHDFRFTKRGCAKCGADVRPVVDELAAPLAAWLEWAGRQADMNERRAPRHRYDLTEAVAVARAINSTTAPAVTA